MYPTAKSVKALDGTVVEVEFDNGERKRFDVSRLFETHPYFTRLNDGALFNKVRVDYDGYALVWDPEIDLATSAVWLKGSSAD